METVCPSNTKSKSKNKRIKMRIKEEEARPCYFYLAKNCQDWCAQSFVQPALLVPFAGSQLPYDIASLEWDHRHYHNKQQKYCYCGLSRTRDSPMYRCFRCSQWFHKECLKDGSQIKTFPVAEDPHYEFLCCLCHREGGQQREMLNLKARKWREVGYLALFHLRKEVYQFGQTQVYYFKRAKIFEWIAQHWDAIMGVVTQSKKWRDSVISAISICPSHFASGYKKFNASGFWGLRGDVNPYFSDQLDDVDTIFSDPDSDTGELLNIHRVNNHNNNNNNNNNNSQKVNSLDKSQPKSAKRSPDFTNKPGPDTGGEHFPIDPACDPFLVTPSLETALSLINKKQKVEACSDRRNELALAEPELRHKYAHQMLSKSKTFSRDAKALRRRAQELAFQAKELTQKAYILKDEANKLLFNLEAEDPDINLI